MGEETAREQRMGAGRLEEAVCVVVRGRDVVVGGRGPESSVSG